jgi:hypothetical protein
MSQSHLFPSDADVCLLLLGVFVCFSSQGITPSLSFSFISETTALLKQTQTIGFSSAFAGCVWIGLNCFVIQGGTVMVLNGGPVAQRGRQEQPRKAELVQ